MKKEIIENIKRDVEDQANLVINQIGNEISALYNNEIENFKEGLKKEQDTFLEKELNDLRVLSVTESSRAKLNTKHKLLNLRQELVNSLFDETREMLVEFTKGKDYSDYLARKIDETVFDEGYMLVRECDKDLISKLLKGKKINTEINTANILIGCFKYVSESRGIEYDYTLDNSFEEQMQWFISNSKFTV